MFSRCRPREGGDTIFQRPQCARWVPAFAGTTLQGLNAMAKVKAYEAMAQAFVAEGVDTLFTLMGDANMHWANSMAQRNGVRVVHTRHEHCACTAAISYAWATSKPGIASVTCGPGFTQTMTALATAARGHVPIVIVAGETNPGAPHNNQRLAQAPVANAPPARHIPVHQIGRLPRNARAAFHGP